MIMKKKFRNLLASLMVITLIVSGTTPIQALASGKTDYSAVFDAEYYYNAYADLRAAFGNDQKALPQHFVTYGMREGRRGTAEFDVWVYMQNNADLINAFGK